MNDMAINTFVPKSSIKFHMADDCNFIKHTIETILQNEDKVISTFLPVFFKFSSFINPNFRQFQFSSEFFNSPISILVTRNLKSARSQVR